MGGRSPIIVLIWSTNIINQPHFSIIVPNSRQWKQHTANDRWAPIYHHSKSHQPTFNLKLLTWGSFPSGHGVSWASGGSSFMANGVGKGPWKSSWSAILCGDEQRPNGFVARSWPTQQLIHELGCRVNLSVTWIKMDHTKRIAKNKAWWCCCSWWWRWWNSRRCPALQS